MRKIAESYFKDPELRQWDPPERCVFLHQLHRAKTKVKHRDNKKTLKDNVMTQTVVQYILEPIPLNELN